MKKEYKHPLLRVKNVSVQAFLQGSDYNIEYNRNVTIDDSDEIEVL